MAAAVHSTMHSPTNPVPNDVVTPQKLEHYFSVTKEALAQAREHFNKNQLQPATEVWDMAQRYYDDAHYFYHEKNDLVLAFAALNYAHGWLDAGARLGLFQVKDRRLFTVDE